MPVNSVPIYEIESMFARDCRLSLIIEILSDLTLCYNLTTFILYIIWFICYEDSYFVLVA